MDWIFFAIQCSSIFHALLFPVVEVWIEIRCIFSPWISIIFVELGCGRRPPGALDLAGFSFHVPTHGSADIATVATAAKRKRIVITVRFISESFHYKGCYFTEASIVFPKSRKSVRFIRSYSPKRFNISTYSGSTRLRVILPLNAFAGTPDTPVITDR